jgi:hypothetical protein
MKRERSLSEPWHGLEMDESERPASTFTCPDCGALYEVAVRNQVSNHGPRAVRDLWDCDGGVVHSLSAVLQAHQTAREPD